MIAPYPDFFIFARTWEPRRRKKANGRKKTSLMTGPSGFGNDPLQLVDLSLRTAEGSELLAKQFISLSKLGIWGGGGRPKETYPLLSELTRTLIFAVAEQFDHALLVGSKSSWARFG